MRKIVSIVLIYFSFSALSKTWNQDNLPEHFGISDYSFYNLSMSAELDFDGGPWSGYHWPNKVNSLHYTPSDQRYSPIEKWEMADLDGDFYDIKDHVNQVLEANGGVTWGGFCHGYSAASLEYSEPSKKIINGVKFYHSDIKAYLAIYYDYLLMNNIIQSRYIGVPCRKSVEDRTIFGNISKECSDVNPASFHLALNQKIAVEKKGFVMDMERFNEIWNVPVVGYSSVNLGEVSEYDGDRARNSKKALRVRTEVSYLTYQKPEEDKEILGKKGQKIRKKTFEYIIELNKYDEVIGGVWISEKRPDFLWITSQIPRPSEEWEFLNQLLD